MSNNKTTNDLLHRAFGEALTRLNGYSYQEVLYSVLKYWEVKDISDLLKKELEVMDLYALIYEAVRNEKEEDFTTEELEEINNNIKQFNNSIKWERLKSKM